MQSSERRWTLGILGFVILVTLGGCGPSDQEILSQAISADEKGDLDSAHSVLHHLRVYGEPGVKAEALQYLDRVLLLRQPSVDSELEAIAEHLELYPDFVGNPWIYKRRHQLYIQSLRIWTAYSNLLKLAEESRDSAVVNWANSKIPLVAEWIEEYYASGGSSERSHYAGPSDGIDMKISIVRTVCSGQSRGARIRVEGAVRRLHTEHRASFARCEPWS
jgi:hypothetical protein